LEYILSTCENPFHLVNERDIYHSTPLHIAAHSGMSNCVKVLLKYKVRVRTMIFYLGAR
jgi:ankyrin repeat protein